MQDCSIHKCFAASLNFLHYPFVQGIKVFFVTHLYEFAHGFYDKNMQNATFLRAERQADGKRTFKLLEGEPLQTSFGEDVFHRIFATDK